MTDGPTKEHLDYALGKFQPDADNWNTMSAVIGQAHDGAAGLSIDPLAFGPTAWGGLHDKYRELQHMVMDLTAAAQTQFSAVAQTLIAVRDTYQKEENENLHAIKGVW